jgi:hypothetical protein
MFHDALVDSGKAVFPARVSIHTGFAGLLILDVEHQLGGSSGQADRGEDRARARAGVGHNFLHDSKHSNFKMAVKPSEILGDF